jgi:DNA polymerase-3 subunit delta
LTGKADTTSTSLPQATLIVSTESLLVQEAEDALRMRILPEDPGGMNHLSLYGWDADLGQVLEFLQTMPFLAERRLLVIREIQKFKDWKELVGYLKDPNPSSYLILTSTELRKKDAAYRTLSKHADLNEIRKPYSNAMSGWVVKRFRGLGKKIDSRLADVLVSVAGDNLAALAAEIDKVAIHSGDRDQVREEDLDVVMPGGVSTIFNLLDALGDGNKREALVALERIMETEGRPEMILAMIARHYRQLLRGQALVSRGKEPKAAARELGVAFPNLQEKFARHLRRADQAKLESALKAVSSCDLELKRGRVPGQLLLDRLTLELLA